MYVFLQSNPIFNASLGADLLEAREPILTAASVEVVGYAFRATGLHEDTPDPSTYVISSILITIAPGFIAASLYQLLAHIILANGRGRTQLITKLGLGFGFGALDVLGYVLQAAGK